MYRPHLIYLAVFLAVSISDAKALARPVKVQLPKGMSPKPREPLNQLTAEQMKGPNRKRIASKGLFQLDFDKVDIDKLVQTISDMTGKLFILPENIRGKISIVGPEHGKVGVTANEAYAAFVSALDSNGLTLYPVGKYLKIVEKRSGKQSNIPTLLDESSPYTTNEQMITKLFKLRYVEAEPVRAVIQQLVSRDGDSIAFPPDIIIVNDIGLNMHRLERIIERLDSLTSTDEIRVIQIQYAAASDIAEKLRQVFEDKNRKPGQRSGQAAIPGKHAAKVPVVSNSRVLGDINPASLSQIIADERTNKLIIIANEKAYVRIQELLKQLDTPMPGEGSVHVYYLKNANAEDLATTLASLTQGVTKNPTGRPPNVPGAPGIQKGTTNTVAELFSGEVKITADKSTNSLVIIANNSDYRNVVNVVEKLDMARRQVFVEAVIMEVNLNNQLDFGISTHGGKEVNTSSDHSSLLFGASEQNKTAAQSLSPFGSLLSLNGFLAGLQGPLLSDLNSSLPNVPAFSIVLQAMQSSSDVNVLSTPHILASDNEEAEITVGQNVPFQAGITSPLLSGLTGFNNSTTSNSSNVATSLATSSLLGTGLIAPIQRQNVELKLKIKPQINEGDQIRLVIEEQTEEIASINPTLGPTTSKRSAKTTVVARNQQTVVTGGLIQERTTRGVSKVPLLGDIPLLGWLFRSTTETKTRTNLLLFLTPYIIRDQTDFRRIFERKMKERQEFVELFLGRKPGYKVPIDYARKAGPLAKMISTVEMEAKKLENGGPGISGERLITPKWENSVQPENNEHQSENNEQQSENNEQQPENSSEQPDVAPSTTDDNRETNPSDNAPNGDDSNKISPLPPDIKEPPSPTPQFPDTPAPESPSEINP